MKAVKKQTKSMGAWVKKNSGQIKGMGVAIAAMGAAALLTFKKMVKEFVDMGDMIHKMALRTGFAAETLSELAFAAEISGADITMLEKGTKKMAKTISDASDGLETYLRVFRKLGLEVDDLLKMKPEEQFFTIGAAIAEMENVTLRTAAAVDVFGRSGTMLLPFFKEGAEGIAKLRKEAHTLGIIFDEETAAKAAALKDAQTALTGSVKGLSIAILTDLIPIITSVTKKFTDWFVENRKHAGAWVKSLLGAFQFIARGIQGLLLAWQGLKTGVFLVAEALTKSIVKIAEGLLWIAKLTPGTEIFYAEKLRDIIKDLTFVSEGYREEKEKGIDTMTDIIVKYEAFVATLDKVKAGLSEVKKEQKKSADELGIMDGVLAQAQTALESYTFAAEKSSEATKETSKAQQRFTVLAIANFANMEASMAGFVDAMLSTLEQWAIGEIIPKIMAALPFPLNLLATGGAILAIKTIFKGIRGLAEGGALAAGEPAMVGERGAELFVPSTPGTIVPLEKGLRPVQLKLEANIFITAMDTLGVRDFMRERGMDEILEALRNKVMLPEFQEALGIK